MASARIMNALRALADTVKSARVLLRVSYQIDDYSLIGSYVWDQVIMRRKIDTETDYFK